MPHPGVPVRTHSLRVIAQDPAIRSRGRILTAAVEVPAEVLGPGPWGYRAQVVDYDASTDTLYKPCKYETGPGGVLMDPFASASDEQLLTDPRFHAQNVYAIVMRVLARFEAALGRRVGWSFDGHQIKIVPHAFADSNAFYSKEDEALLFGYFRGRQGNTILSSLSHDVVAHETTHALVDGLRSRYTNPSSSDQAAFHEGFSDVVALLSIFALPDVVKVLLDLNWGGGEGGSSGPESKRVAERRLTISALRESALFGLAKEMGQEMLQVRGRALRHSVVMKPSPAYYRKDPEFCAPHKRGEIFVAAVMNSFVAVWAARVKELRRNSRWTVNRDRVAEEGASAADTLLTMCIRALDYCPPVHLVFGDFLSAVLTADHEIRPADAKYHFRNHLRRNFAAYGIAPASPRTETEPGLWMPPMLRRKRASLSYSRSHVEPLQRDPEEVFRFVWENRKTLGLVEDVYTRVESVRPCLRVSDDGFILRETVAEYVQVLRLQARDLHSFRGIKRPKGLPPDTPVTLYGGGVLILDEFGHVKFHIHNRIDNHQRQTQRLQELLDHGFFSEGARFHQRFSLMHRMRAMNSVPAHQEGWL